MAKNVDWRFRTQRDAAHFDRGRMLLQTFPELRSLLGYDRRTAFVSALLTFTQLALACAPVRISARHPYLVAIVLALGVGAVLSHWLGMVIHEASHNLVARTPSMNRLIGILASLPMLVPMSETFRRYHLEHHRNLGVEAEDTDLPHAFEVRVIGRSRWKKALWIAAYALVYMGRGATFAKRPNRGEVLNAIAVAVFLGLVWTLLGGTAVAYLFASTLIGHSFHPVAAHFIHEHYVFHEAQETYSYYGPLNYVTFNVGFHNEHHDLPGISGWNLPQLRATAPHYYAPLDSHVSWTQVLLQFILDPKMGPAARVVRRRKTKMHGTSLAHASSRPLSVQDDARREPCVSTRMTMQTHPK